MTIQEFEQGIYEAVIKASLARPHEDDTEEWGKWVQDITTYLYEFSIRFKQKGLKFEDAKRKAWWATKRRIKEDTVARIMNIPLPHETVGLYHVLPAEVCECGELKSKFYDQCQKCAEKRYEEKNDAE